MQENVRRAQAVLTFFLDEIFIRKNLDQVNPILSENLIVTIPEQPGQFCDKNAFISYLREMMVTKRQSSCLTYRISSEKALSNSEVAFAVTFIHPVEQSAEPVLTFPDTAYFTLSVQQGSYQITTVHLHRSSHEVPNQQKSDQNDQYRKLVECTGTTIFEYDIDLDQMDLFLLADSQKKKKFHSMTIKDFSLKEKNELVFIHPADRDRVIWSLKNKQPFNGTEIRFRVLGLGHSDYYWHEVYGSVSRNMDGRENRYIGMLRFVDTEKKRILDLTTKAERDCLTTLYNKLSVEQIINQSIENNSSAKHAFLLLDIDNFKIINDSAGHPFGDLILKLFAKLLSDTFRTNDVIGRIGGDEFVVFMQDIRDTVDVLDKAQGLITTFKKEYIRRNFSLEEKKNCHLFQVMNSKCDCQISYSCSIGISFYDADGSNFYQLYNAADTALYQAKESGRNRYVCYQKTDQNLAAENPVLLPPTGEPLEN